MTINSADKKPEKYIGPDGKPKIRMVPVDRNVIKSEAANASKEAQRHMQGMKDARADMKVAKSADAMTKAMNKLQHHTKAHKKAMAAMGEAKDPEEYDKEGDMAKTQLKTMIDAAQELHDQLSDDENMPEWVQNKITKATDYIDSVRDYMKNNDDVNEETQLDEYGGPPISRDKYLKQKPMKERELTPAEMKKREKYAQDLPDDEFKKRYGDRWKSVKIATATKMAKGEK